MRRHTRKGVQRLKGRRSTTKHRRSTTKRRVVKRHVHRFRGQRVAGLQKIRYQVIGSRGGLLQGKEFYFTGKKKLSFRKREQILLNILMAHYENKTAGGIRILRKGERFR